MKIIKSYLKKNPCYKAKKKIKIKGMMLHSIGCPQPSAKAFVNSWNNPSMEVCVHAFIDGNTGKIYQTLPWNYKAWHCGGSGNNTHISVEMCEPDCIKYVSGATFTCSDLKTARAVAKRTYNAAVELFADRCKKYKLDPMKKGVIISHREGYSLGIASNHGDPEHLWKQLGLDYTMDTFRKAVKKKMTAKKKTPSTTTAEKTVTEVAKEVIAGKWGNGTDRKKKLEKAGYDYSAVQKKFHS